MVGLPWFVAMQTNQRKLMRDVPVTGTGSVERVVPSRDGQERKDGWEFYGF